MKKLSMLMLLAFFSISNVCLADDTNPTMPGSTTNATMPGSATNSTMPGSATNSTMPLSKTMDENMKAMASTYLKKVGEDLQLRATDLYAMGEALVSHPDHPQCQAQGQLAIREAKKLYLISQEILNGKEVSPARMEKFVNDWP
jgi:hypothetical protein